MSEPRHPHSPAADPPVLDANALRRLADAANRHPARAPCRCGVGACPAWESVTEERWPKAQLPRVGTLRPADGSDPGFEEYHPNGTRYSSPEAPVAPGHFPYHRCDAFQCTDCQRVLLRYTEYGGYYVDHRVREVHAAQVVEIKPQLRGSFPGLRNQRLARRR